MNPFYSPTEDSLYQFAIVSRAYVKVIIFILWILSHMGELVRADSLSGLKAGQLPNLVDSLSIVAGEFFFDFCRNIPSLVIGGLSSFL